MVFTVVDIETTGLSKSRHNIIEIAAARVRNGKIVKSYQALINPNERIPSFITGFTGITNEMVKHAPTIKYVLPEFIEFLNDDVFVAHNARFDFGFCDHNLQTIYKKALLNQTLCTRKLANRLYPELPSKKLGLICSHLGIVNHDAHRAEGDVRATVAVLRTMLDRMNDMGIHKTEDILRFERSPIRR